MGKYSFYLIIAVLMFSACYREDIIEIDSSGFSKKIVVYSVISPQTDSIYVTLFETNSDFIQLFDTSVVIPTGKVVLASETDQFILKQIEVKPAVYACSQHDFPIRKGKTYHLTVEIEGYTKTIAKTHVPDKFCQWEETPTINYGIIDIPLGGTFFSYFFNGFWEPSCNINEKNYFGYKTGGIIYELEPTLNESTGYRGFHYRVTDSVYYQSKGFRIIEADAHYSIIEHEQNMEISDYIFEGFAVEFKNGAIWKPNGIIYKNITYYLLTVDENYSNYLNMLAKYQERGNYGEDSLLSFSWIMPSYTNIEGGYGVFGSYGFDSVYFDVSENVKHY
ncbi:MAG: DUF4249 family protein [Bacteroidales bacterium]|nr:DUF4249 family protein [Bacteroidales bacterium]